MKTKRLLPPSHFIFFPGLLSLLHSQFIYLFLHPEWHSGRGNGGSGQPRTALLLLPPHSFSCSGMGPSQGCSLSWNSTCPGVVSVGSRGMTRSTMVFPYVFRHSSPRVSLTSLSEAVSHAFFFTPHCCAVSYISSEWIACLKPEAVFVWMSKYLFRTQGAFFRHAVESPLSVQGRYSIPAPALGAVGTAWAAPPDMTELALLGGGITAGRYRRSCSLKICLKFSLYDPIKAISNIVLSVPLTTGKQLCKYV